MDYSVTFARHFARLVSLLMYDAANVDEQKVSLRALVTVSRNGSVSLTTRDSQLHANEQEVPGALMGVSDLASQMIDHSLTEIHVEATSNAADLLGLARIVATRPGVDDKTAHVTQKLSALGAKSIRVVTATPAPTAAAPVVATTENAREATIAIDVTKVSIPELLAVLDASDSQESATRALDDLALLAEHSLRIGKPTAVADIFHGLISRDTLIGDGDLKRAYVIAIRRMSKPALLRAVATLIPRQPERKQLCYEVLLRTGEDGADAVIEQITQAQTNEDRRSLLDVLSELESGVPALIRMLGDSRWFVARNAADLLGEIVAKSAEPALVGALRHGDDRVRRSATNALLRLGTPNALQAIYDAVNDTSADVRMQAAAAIATRNDDRSSTTLIRAIEDEEDVDVQLAMIAALGRVATPEAVQKLVKMAEPEGRMFRRKTTSIRVAATQALGEARTPAALSALRDLAEDKDQDVRETANRALAQASAL